MTKSKIFGLSSKLSFFHYLGQKWQPLEKTLHGKNLDFEIFGLKYVLKHSDTIPTKKVCIQKFFDYVIFSLFCPKNDRVPGKKLYTENIFDFDIFGSKCDLKHCESNFQSDLTKKFWLCHFLAKVIKNDRVPGKNHTEKSISRFSVQNTYWNILDQLRPKKFLPNFFWLCHFFTILAKNGRTPGKKYYLGKNFRFSAWITFWNIRNQFWPKDRPKIFNFVIFSPFLLHFDKRIILRFKHYIQKFWAIIGLSSLSELSRLTRFSAFLVENAQK